MKAIIMAAGNYRSFDRKKIVINEETLITRTIRQLLERNVTDIKITASFLGQHLDIPNAVEVLNEMTGHNLGCLYGIKNIEADIYLYSDVFYSNYAMDKIVEGETTYYGRSDPSPIKKYGEFFAFRNDPIMWKYLDIAWKAYEDKKIDRLWSWDLYAYHIGKWSIDDGILPRKQRKREQYLTPKNFTNINDWTDDFDNEGDVEIWLKHFGDKHD